MPIRCPKCGYSNEPGFRFCGMCGSTLNREPEEPAPPRSISSPRSPEPRTASAPNFSTSPPRPTSPHPRWTETEDRVVTRTDAAPKRDYSTVSGPSFLGLDPIPSSEPTPQYLLEDDEPSGHGRLLIGLLLLLAVGGGLFWQWQREGYPWNPGPKKTASTISSEVPEPPSNAPLEATQPSSVPTTEEPKTEAAPPTEQKTETPPPATATKEDTPAESQPDKATSHNTDNPAKAAAEDKPEPKPESKPVQQAATPSPAKAKREVRRPAPEPADLPDPSEALFADGQRYLYGSGVPEDCGRARTKLMAAANQSNPKAQSTVATMYATGHCLPRNLPSAYHWFALALHQDRDNMRLQRDLEMIWGQMTAEEKQIALKGR